MSKTLTYTSDKWPGSVTFADPMTLEQEAAWELAIAAYRDVSAKGGGLSAQNAALLPGIEACVVRWELKDFPERITLQNFPTRPRAERAKLVAWLVTNLTEIYMAGEEIPNG